MRHLEQRRHAEDLCQVGTDAGEHVVVEEDIALDFLGQRLNCARVVQAELCPPLGEVIDGISYCSGDGVGEDEGPQCVHRSGHDGGGMWRLWSRAERKLVVTDEETESPRCAGERSKEVIGVLEIIQCHRQASAVGCLLLCRKKRSVKLRRLYWDGVAENNFQATQFVSGLRELHEPLVTLPDCDFQLFLMADMR